MGMAGMWYPSKHFLSSANISLSIIRTVLRLIIRTENHKNSTPSKIKFHIIFIFFSIMDIKIFTTGGVRGGAVGGGKCFFDRATILFHQCNNTTLQVLFLSTLIFYT